MSKLKELENLFEKGKITRREFLARASALGIAATLSPMLFSNSAQALTPKKGGRLRLGMAGGHTTNSMDPVTYNDIMMQMTSMGLLRNTLVEQDYKGNIIPELAESWETSTDVKQWTFKLRKGVEFHNGKTLDADDVIFSVNHHRGEKSKSGIKQILEPVKEIKKDGKHTLIFNLKTPNADFPYLFASTRLCIAPAGTTNWDKGIGTGGYKLVKFEPGIRLFAKRNPNYFKEGRAHFDEVDITVVADVTARTSALKTGKIDVMNRPDRKTVHLLGQAPGVQIVNTPGGLQYSFPMLCDVPPYDNNDARLALKYAVDREQLLNTILRGYGYLGNDHPIPPIVKFHASELPQRNYDPEKAKYHLKKAGLEGQTFKLHTSDAAFEGAVDAAVLYKESAAKAGIKIEVVREPKDGYWQNVWNKKPWSASFWFARATADWMFSAAFSADSPWNDTHWRHARFNKLLKEARAELDNKKRREMYVEMQQIVRDEGGTVIPMYANLVDAASSKLKFENVAGNWELDGLRVAERWWFES
jgi:peptide/nickel transport system substrate-binding protein